MPRAKRCLVPTLGEGEWKAKKEELCFGGNRGKTERLQDAESVRVRGQERSKVTPGPISARD